MRWMLDATAFSDLMRDDPRARARLASLPSSDQMSLCSRVRGEILHGLARLPVGERRRKLEVKSARLFGAILCVPVSESAADHYAEIKLSRQSKGSALDADLSKTPSVWVKG